MMYRHTWQSKLFSLVTVVFLAGVSAYVTQLGYRLIFLTFTVIMLRDSVRIFTAQFTVSEDGLFLDSRAGNKQIADWYHLEYITITKRNRRWVALVSGDKIFYFKNNVEDFEQLLKDIVACARKNKSLCIHDDINEKYHLGLKLNDEGRIMSAKSK